MVCESLGDFLLKVSGHTVSLETSVTRFSQISKCLVHYFGNILNIFWQNVFVIGRTLIVLNGQILNLRTLIVGGSITELQV